MSITNPADCYMRSVIRFLNAKNIRRAENLRQLVEAYGRGFMNHGNLHKRCRLFTGGRADVTMKPGLHAHATSQRIRSTGLKLMCMKIGDSPLMSFMTFFHVLRCLPSTRCSQMSTTRNVCFCLVVFGTLPPPL
jgi:hypothetical protein